ncbi:hypothetical protein FKG94_07420 [Exilibacterium tricleocarpae]|uniref:DUF4124 domain-containing protein n=1 Tax=Exilibacterium tricleocarpae TaxID=2591008 RepID=A0A545TZB4_9GAMM|nr:hypothetical protein [Exilibacterium tricleocarpae]TQV82554.1 hypothetical protein FKG94_07420 [Exilibacterium tricleocarpae]
MKTMFPKTLFPKTPSPKAACRIVFIAILGCVAAGAAVAEIFIYRYVNEDGVKVINHFIPPEFAQKGYEVLNRSGEVVKVVQPAVSKEEAAQREKVRVEQEALARWDKSLRRRYSTVGDIEAAKERKLGQLNANMSLLRTNITGLREELETHQSRAANLERAGRFIPQSLLTNIRNLKSELEHTKAQVIQREAEYDEVAAKYDRDIERFKEIAVN